MLLLSSCDDCEAVIRLKSSYNLGSENFKVDKAQLNLRVYYQVEVSGYSGRSAQLIFRLSKTIKMSVLDQERNVRGF